MNWWDDLRISMAGARLSHLVQEDGIWDHGTMIEHVRTVFLLLQKAAFGNRQDNLAGYLTATAWDRREQDPLLYDVSEQKLVQIYIIDIRHGKKRKDGFTALVKMESTDMPAAAKQLQQHWYFIQERGWWLLDHIK